MKLPQHDQSFSSFYIHSNKSLFILLFLQKLNHILFCPLSPSLLLMLFELEEESTASTPLTQTLRSPLLQLFQSHLLKLLVPFGSLIITR